MNNLNSIVEAAKQFAVIKINAFPENIVYHDIKFADNLQNYAEKIVSHSPIEESEKKIAQIGLWLIAASYGNGSLSLKKGHLVYTNLEKESLKNLEAFNKSKNLDGTIVKKIETAFKEMFAPNIPKTQLGMLLADSISADLVMGNSSKKLKKLYEELLLGDTTISKKKWYDVNIQIAKSFKFNLPFCKTEIQPLQNQLLLDLEKNRKQIEKTSEVALKKELDISDVEFKQLKKEIENSKKLDVRGLQTLFRVTSKNHYTLNVMVDKKASIMITVNSIILSLVIGGLIGDSVIENHKLWFIQNIPILILTITSITSIIFAILSIRPGTTHGEFTEEDIRNKKGNLLYYGNYHNMQVKDYEWAFLQMMNDRDYLYASMIKDIYFLGQILNKKYIYIRIALTIFLGGLISAVIALIIVRFILYSQNI